MSSTNPTPTKPCPHCNAEVPVDAPYCAACGDRINRALKGPESTNSTEFAWGLILILLFVMPLAACGGCALFSRDSLVVPFAMLGLGGGSFAIGMIMVIANIVKSFSKK